MRRDLPAGPLTDARAGNVPAVKMVGLGKRYSAGGGGDVTALESIDLDVTEHEFVVLLGPSGCGKSTLLKIVAGLIKQSSGQLRIFGEIPDGPIEGLGMGFQDDLLLPWRDVVANIMLQADLRRLPRSERRAYEDRARELLRRVGLGGFEHHFPRQLSGGMRQRVALVRALIHDPKLLLLDEPFAAVDAITRDQIANDLQRIWLDTRKTVLFVTHNISEAVFLADRVIVMSPRPGRVVEITTIGLPRPRTLADRDSEESVGYVRHIRGVLQAMGLYRS